MEIKIGLTNSKSVIVNENNVASSAGSGLLDVFATPFMCALMEQAAGEAIQPYLDEGWFSVGTALDIKHVSATPIGMTVTATAVVEEIDRRSITFYVKAEDEVGLIGEGKHTRFIVEGTKFMERTINKIKK